MDNRMPIMVFNLMKQGNIRRVLHGEDIGTTVGDKE
jgi:uridylate kinase